MKRRMMQASSEQVEIVILTADPPGDAEFDEWIELATKGRVRTGYLVITPGPGPSVKQGAMLADTLRSRGLEGAAVAFVTAAPLVRRTAQALLRFLPRVAVFEPDALAEALRYAGVSEANVVRTVEMVRDLGAVRF